MGSCHFGIEKQVCNPPPPSRQASAKLSLSSDEIRLITNVIRDHLTLSMLKYSCINHVNKVLVN